MRGFSWMLVAVVAATLGMMACDDGEDSPWGIDSPYGSIDWESVGRYRGNFHTHTTNSDGQQHPHTVIDGYAALGYSVLAITDHNRVTFPWTALADIRPGVYENRDPVVLGMVAIEGQELSRHDHTGSLFNDFDDEDQDINRSMQEVGARGGIAILCHPGRYNRDVGFYVDLFRTNAHLTGMEIYNQGDRYPSDRARWDAVLTAIVTDRPVWGYSADDSHNANHIGRNWSLLLMSKLGEGAVKSTLQSGRFFWVYDPNGPAGAAPVDIASIAIDRDAGTIGIDAPGASRIEWISEGATVHTGASISLGETEGVGAYVRAVVYGSEGTQTGTQPFIIRKRPEPAADEDS